MQYEEYKPRENQITIGQLFKVIIGYNKKSLIRFAIITAAIWLIGFLAIFLGYNRMKNQYQTDWTYNISTFDGSTYIDGSQFYYPDLISIENLKIVQESDPDFKDLDIETIVANDGIRIVKNAVSEKAPYKFTLYAKASYFKNEKQAISFIKLIIETPIRKINELVDLIDNTQYLVQFKENSVSYEDLVKSLQKQAELVNSGYSTLLTSYGNRFIKTNENKVVRLNDVLIQTRDEISAMQLNGLNDIVDNNSYVYKYDEQLPRLKTTLANLNKDLELINKKIDAIQTEIDRQINLGASSVALDALNNSLAELLLQREDTNNKIQIVEDKINLGATQDTSEFDAMLENYYNTLSSLTDNFTFIQKELHTSDQKVFYSTNNITKTVGGMSIVVSLGLPLLLGIVAAAIVNLSMDLKKYLSLEKEKKNEKDNTVKEA